MVLKVQKLIDENLEFFGDSKSIATTLRNLEMGISKTLSCIDKIREFATDFDFNEKTTGNGYHSFVDIFDSAIEKIHENLLKLSKSRQSFFFNVSKFDE